MGTTASVRRDVIRFTRNSYARSITRANFCPISERLITKSGAGQLTCNFVALTSPSVSGDNAASISNLDPDLRSSIISLSRFPRFDPERQRKERRGRKKESRRIAFARFVRAYSARSAFPPLTNEARAYFTLNTFTFQRRNVSV